MSSTGLLATPHTLAAANPHTLAAATPHVLALDLVSEDSLRSAVDLLVRLVESAGALVIFVGAVYAFVRFVIAGIRRKREEAFVLTRLGLGRFLALGLEFQLASDVLRTAIAPSFQEIGKLAAIAAIRTALNYFLAKEIAEEKEQVAANNERRHAQEAGERGAPSEAAAAEHRSREHAAAAASHGRSNGDARNGDAGDVDLRDHPDTLAGSTEAGHDGRRS